MTGVRRAAVALTLAGIALGSAGVGARSPAAAPATGTGTIATLAGLERAAADARSLDPGAVQRLYDAARAVEAHLSGTKPSRRCRPFATTLAAAARAGVGAAEAFDRRHAQARRAAELRMGAMLAAARRARASCATGIEPAPASAARPGQRLLLAPQDGEAFFGVVEVAVPAGTRHLELRYAGRVLLQRDDPRAGVSTLHLPATSAPGSGRLEVSLRSVAGAKRDTVERAWLLPRSRAGTAPAPARRDRALEARLAHLASSFRGYAGIYFRELSTGRTAAWNAEARFPAASTVKLGVLVAGLERLGSRAGSSSYLHDLWALATWSSNLATNRLVAALGAGDRAAGARIVEAMLRRLGAGHSTYPGDYRVGTSRSTSPGQPPAVSARTTSAADLGRVLTTLQSAAAGDRRAVSRSGISSHVARVAVALLLGSQPSGDNLGPFRPWLPSTVPVAQKHGWISSARHSAAIVYGERGPVVVVLLTYRDGLRAAEARELGRRVLRAALP